MLSSFNIERTMKNLFTKNGLCLLLMIVACLSVNVFCQTKDTAKTKESLLVITQTRLDSAKANISLNGEWKFHPGDDTAWAEKNYNDTNWSTLKNNFYMDSIKTGTWTGIGWFRKKFKIDSTMFHKPAAFIVTQRGASEFYLNGKLIKKFGTISKDINKEKAYNPQDIPFIVVFDTSQTQELAVRYANHKAQEYYERYKGPGNFGGFNLAIGKNDRSITSRVSNALIITIFDGSIGAITFAFALLHLLIFFFYSRERENLFYGLFAGSMTLLFGVILFVDNIHLVSDITYIINMSVVIWGTILFATFDFFLYAIFYKKMPKQFWIILILGAVLGFLSIFVFTQDWFFNYINGPFLLLLTAEGLRVVILAIKRRKRNALIIGTGVLIFFLFIAYIPISNIFSINTPLWLRFVLYGCGLLSLPILMSIYLARESAKTKVDLENRIVEVQDLSDKAIEHEKREADLRVENARQTHELEEARKLQLSMLPNEIPNHPNLEIAVSMETATEVGGDYYDFAVALDGTLNIALGDATGHGMQAGTLVTIMKGIFTLEAGQSEVIPFFKKSVEAIKEIKLGRLMMAFVFLKIKDSWLSLANAGVPPVYIYRKDKNEVEEIDNKGMPLGAMNNYPYKETKTDLKSGDVIYLLSDGFPELSNNEMEIYGYERVRKIFKEVAEYSSEEIIEKLKNEVDKWAGGKVPEDDVTFVVIKVK